MAQAFKHLDLVEKTDTARREASGRLSAARADLGQFFTPGETSRLMAEMFPDCDRDEVGLLDAGAGLGTLTAALVEEVCTRTKHPRRIRAVAYEIDADLVPYLRATLDSCQRRCAMAGIEFAYDLRNEDFLEAAVRVLKGFMFNVDHERFDFAIVNPPYRKIKSDSRERALLRAAGIETSNLYSGFLSLIVELLTDSGELVMITPRSFCNGPYFRRFRKSFLKSMALRRIHIYDSRSSAFKDDDVLQENVIVHATKTPAKPTHAIISSNQGPGDPNVRLRTVDYSELVSPSDPDSFIHIPSHDEEASIAKRMRNLPSTLKELGVSVSTGRVVDFRARNWIKREAEQGTAPLIYPTHLSNAGITWPKPGGRKPNAIIDSPETSDLLIPNDYYVVVKRFSSKEERRRVVAAVSVPDRLPAERIGFENHLNYFHMNGGGLNAQIAYGLAAFLNSTLVDRYFRQFNGHTQVNAHDLRSLPYPKLEDLCIIGTKAIGLGSLQSEIDRLIDSILPMATKEALTL